MESHLNQSSPQAHGGRICLIAYSDPDLHPAARNTFLIAVFEQTGSLNIFVNPDWKGFVHTRDVQYLEALLSDFKLMASSAAEGLFTQLTSLNVGPITTAEVRNFSDSDALKEAIPSHFSRII